MVFYLHNFYVYLHIFVCFIVIHSLNSLYSFKYIGNDWVLFFLTQDDAKIDQLQTVANYDRMIMITIAWPVNREAWICVPSHLVSEKNHFQVVECINRDWTFVTSSSEN